MPYGVTGSNLDFASPIEALNALQRNPQIQRLVVTGSLSASFTASAIYAVMPDSGNVVIHDTTAAYKVTGPAAAVFPFGAPTVYAQSLSAGACIAVLSASTVFCTILYK